MKFKCMKRLNLGLLLIITGIFLTACGSGGSTAGQGTLSTSLTDSSTDEYQAVYVTIARVEVHHDGDGSWQTVASPNKTYNLLDLVNGVRESLGIASLDAGHYTQMRLIIGNTADNGMNMFSRMHDHANYTIDQTGAVHKMKVPSGTNTGLKIVNGFDINANQTTELLLDFDAMSSVVKAGSSGQYLLKPTVKVHNTLDYAIVSGTVTDTATTPQLLGGALLTAQVAAPTSVDPKDLIAIEAGTLTADNGEFSLFLKAGDYNLVATQTGYLPACTVVSLLADSSIAEVVFGLEDATTALGTVAGTVSVAGASPDQYVTIDFRKEITCDNATDPTPISVKVVNIANGAAYTLDLPAGDYQVVTSSFGEATQVADITVTTAASTQLDSAF